MNKLLLFILIVCFQGSKISAQEVVVSEIFNSNESINDNEILGRLNGNTLVFVQSEFSLICHYNTAMKIVRIDTLPLSQIKASAFYFHNNIFYFLYKERLNNRFAVKLTAFDLSNKLKQKQSITLDTISKNANDLYEKIIVSSDKSLLSIVFHNESENEIRFINFNATLNKKWTKKLNYENNHLSLHKVAVLNDSSNLALFFDMKERNKEASKLYLFQSKTKKITTYEYNNLKFYDANFAFNYNNKTLYLCAFSSEITTESVDKMTVFSISDSVKINTYNIDENKVQNANNYSKTSSSKGFKDYLINEVVFTKNNDLILVSELYKKYENVLRNSNWDYNNGINVGVPAYGGYTSAQPESTIYVYGNIFLMAISHQNKPLWTELISKRQDSENDYGKLSSFAMLNSGNTLRFFYNDELSNKGTLQMVEIDANGNSKRKTILNNNKYNIISRPKFAQQIAPNAILLPSLYKGKLVYAKIVF